MAAYTKSNPGYTGYPALFFLETLRDGRGDQDLSQRMISLEKRYSYLRAYLPVRYSKNESTTKEYQENIAPKLAAICLEINAMNEQYDGMFEGLSRSPQEKQFLKTMRGVQERIDEVAATSGLIDKISADEEEVIF